MKRSLKLAMAILMGLVSSGSVYFLYIVNSKGTSEIKYIEPDDAYGSLADIIQHPDLKGKVIYVDFWHTGCSPCLREFEFGPALKEKFKGNNDLAFLYLGKDRSVPGEKFRWKKMIEKKKISGYHYFMTNEKFDALWHETVKDTTILKAFPHFIIIDRSGQVQNNNAPRPSQETLPEVLLNVLAQP